ncbi:MAG TPA: hypothetical protein VGK36_06670 [Candidatus Angelobacter sp.]
MGVLSSSSGSNSNTTGFLFSNGTFTHFRFPGSADTFPQDINKNGVIVGWFDVTGQPNLQRAFMVHNGVFHQVTIPGFPNASTVANGVNDLGDIVGQFTGTGSEFGFLLHQGKLTIISFPGATGGTLASSINNQGVIVGNYFISGQSDGTHGFMWKNGAFTNIDFPGAAVTFPVKITNNGDVVGTYIDSAGFQNGFSFDKGHYSTIDRPGFADTRITAGNSFDNVLGFAFTESGGKWFKGFCSSVF